MVRRLPVIQAPPPPEAEIDRPPWRWVVLGAALALALWAAIVSVVLAIGPSTVAVLVGFGAAVALSALLVGRFGPEGHPGLPPAVGASAAALAWILSLLLGPPVGAGAQIAALVVLATVGASAGWAGGVIGRRRATSVARGGPER